MSALSLFNETIQHTTDALLAAPGGRGNDGVFDWLQVKSREAMYTIRILAGVLLTAFVLVVIAKTRMAVAAVVIAALTSGGAYWLIHNMTSVSDRLGTELGSQPSISETITGPDVAGID